LGWNKKITLCDFAVMAGHYDPKTTLYEDVNGDCFCNKCTRFVLFRA